MTSTTASTTTSTSLVDDPQASQTFSLDDSRTVLVIYSAYNDNAVTCAAWGPSHAISVDNVDKAQSWDSAPANYPHRNCIFWVGTLAAGSHTIKGRFCLGSGSGTVTISCRVLLIYILYGDEFQYIDDATTASRNNSTFLDDPNAQVTFTPSAQCKLLALYNASASGTNNGYYGKKVAISIAGVDYGQAEKSPSAAQYPDSVFTCHALQRTAVSTTVKGRFASCYGSGTTVINRRQLAVLCFDDATLMDVITSTTQVTTTSNVLVDDTQALISRTTTEDRELLVVAAGTKRYNTSSNVNGERYGIKVDTNDRIQSRGSGYDITRPESEATAYAELLAAASHTVQGRYSNNTGAGSAAIDARQVVALWLLPVSITSISVTDSGSGTESSVTMTANVPTSDIGAGTESSIEIGPLATDSGVGAEAAPTIQASVAPTDSGAGADTPAIEAALPISETGAGAEAVAMQAALAETDLGAGNETSVQMSAAIPVGEVGVGVDVPIMAASLTVTESPSGSDILSINYLLGIIADSGACINENVTTPGTLTIAEEGKFAEFGWRTKPSSPMIDALALPHVLSIRISDPVTMSDKKVQGGSLPRRKMVGKPGRTVEVDGWSDSQAEIDALDALRDGVRRTFYHPNGDSFGVLVTGFEPSERVDEYDRRSYRLTLAEAN